MVIIESGDRNERNLMCNKNEIVRIGKEIIESEDTLETYFALEGSLK